jgi:hypothetical protein
LEKPTKHDAEKIDVTLVPFKALEAICVGLMYGVKKYGRNNHRTLEEGKHRYLRATLSHFMKHSEGVDETGEAPLDEESGLPHVVLGGCSALLCLAHWAFDPKNLLKGMKDPPAKENSPFASGPKVYEATEESSVIYSFDLDELVYLKDMKHLGVGKIVHRRYSRALDKQFYSMQFPDGRVLHDVNYLDLVLV